MTPRSLVGMTMGARKRAARAQYMYAAYVLRDCRRYVLRLFADTDDGVSHDYKQARKMYRIGQRLRPCPGCNDCGYAPTITMWRLSRDAMWTSGSLAVKHIRNICGGSGVLPAKKAKVLNVG